MIPRYEKSSQREVMHECKKCGAPTPLSVRLCSRCYLELYGTNPKRLRDLLIVDDTVAADDRGAERVAWMQRVTVPPHPDKLYCRICKHGPLSHQPAAPWNDHVRIIQGARSDATETLIYCYPCFYRSRPTYFKD